MKVQLNLEDDPEGSLIKKPVEADVLAILFENGCKLYAVKVPDLGGAPWYGLIHDRSTALVRRRAGEHTGDTENRGEFLNFYKCARCGHEWTDAWTATCDDDCPACGARHVSPWRAKSSATVTTTSQEGIEVPAARISVRLSFASRQQLPDAQGVRI